MLGIDTLNEWLALIGCVFVVWFLIMTLFAPHIPYKLHTAARLRVEAVHLQPQQCDARLGASRQPLRGADQRGAVLSGDARGNPRGAAFHQHGMLHLPARRDRTHVHDGHDGARARRRHGEARRRLGRQLSVRILRYSRDAGGRVQSRVVPALQVVPLVAAEQPHASRAAHRRRNGGVSWWGRCRRPVGRKGSAANSRGATRWRG